MSETEPKLTPRQAAFVAEYLIDLNGAQAAIRAGYSAHTAKEIASENLTKPYIADAVERGKAQRISRVNVTQDNVLQEVSLLAHSNINHYYVDDNGQVTLNEGAPDSAMAAVQSVKRKKTVKEDRDGNVTITYDVELRLWDKPNQLKLMGRHVGLFADRVEHVGKDGGPIETITKVERLIVDPQGASE